MCGGPKKSPRLSPIVQIIFSFWSFEINEGILKTELIIGLDSFFFFLNIFKLLVSILFISVFASTVLLKKAKLQYFPPAGFNIRNSGMTHFLSL